MPTSCSTSRNTAFVTRPQRPSTVAMPTTPAGGASAAATSSPTAAPETRLDRSDCTSCRAPAAPAARGRSTATDETWAVETMAAVGSAGPSSRVSSAAVPIVVASAAT